MVNAHRPSESPTATDTAAPTSQPGSLEEIAHRFTNYMLLSRYAVVELLACPSHNSLLLLFSVALFTYLVDSRQIVGKETDRDIFMTPTRCFVDSKFGGNLWKSNLCVIFL